MISEEFIERYLDGIVEIEDVMQKAISSGEDEPEQELAFEQSGNFFGSSFFRSEF